MIAIGGAIGTGLFVATAGVISQAGPGGAILAYILIELCFTFLCHLLELATFAQYQDHSVLIQLAL